MYLSQDEKERKTVLLLENIKKNLPLLEELLKNVAENSWGREDLVYRYYHFSFKVYGIQNLTTTIYQALQKLSPHEHFEHHEVSEDNENNEREKDIESKRNFCDFFENVVREGTGKKWIPEHNQRWEQETRPLLDAFSHAHYFLEMAVKYGKEIQPEQVNNYMPSGWAALLELYEIR